MSGILSTLRRIGTAYLMVELTGTLLVLPLLLGALVALGIAWYTHILFLTIWGGAASCSLGYVPAIRAGKVSTRILRKAVTGRERST
jgi:hypothetical protein